MDAFHFGNDCIQINTDDNTIFGSENCLFLNVFVPKMCATQLENVKLPVIFYIFGGKFAFGSSSSYGPDFIMETNVILVCSFPFCNFLLIESSVFPLNSRSQPNIVLALMVSYR